MDLKGAANLEQEGSTLTGDVIVYDIVAGRVDASATEEAPVTMVLQPSAMQATESLSPEQAIESSSDGRER